MFGPQSAGLMSIASQQEAPNPMGNSSGIDILSIQDDLKGMSDGQLSQALQGSTPTYLIASEKNRRLKMRKDYESRKSAQEKTVVEDLFAPQQNPPMGSMQQGFSPNQGLNSLPGGAQQPVRMMADGGLVDFIKGQEAFQPTMYDDVGTQAIGYGYNLSQQEIEQGFVTLPDGTQVPLEGGITEKAASSLLEQRLGDNSRAGSNILKEEGVDVDALSPSVLNALQDLTYQTGGGIFNKSPRLVQALKDNDEQAIAEELRTTGRLVNGEILPGPERRANTRADMVSGDSAGVMSRIADFAGNLNPIGTAQAASGDLGRRSNQELVDDNVSGALKEYYNTLENEKDRDRPIGVVERLFEEDSNTDRLDALDALDRKYGDPDYGGTRTLNTIEAASQLKTLLSEAKENQPMGEEILALVRSGEPLTVENVTAIKEKYPGGVAAVVPTDLPITDTAEAQAAAERAAAKDPKEEEDPRRAARQLAFLEAALRVGTSQSPTLTGALAEGIPAIDSYREGLNDISTRAYQEAQTKFYETGRNQIDTQVNAAVDDRMKDVPKMLNLDGFKNRLLVEKRLGLPSYITEQALAAAAKVSVEGNLSDAGDAFKSILRQAYLAHEFSKRTGGYRGQTTTGQASLTDYNL
jgi:GH24 family phage-related lysozyme (muramidase)|tara:strand:+ start:2046 stop:3956 length:1911 start_codon:yes stop_codon:yes gene_type:complete